MLELLRWVRPINSYGLLGDDDSYEGAVSQLETVLEVVGRCRLRKDSPAARNTRFTL